MPVWAGLHPAILALEEDYNRLWKPFLYLFFIAPSAPGRDALAALAPTADPRLLLQQIPNQLQHDATTNGERVLRLPAPPICSC